MHQNRERTRNGYSWGSSATDTLDREVLFTASKEGEEETGGGEAALGQTVTHVSEKIYLALTEDTWSISVHPVCRALIAMSMKGAWETWWDGLPRNQEFSAVWGPSPGMSFHDYLLLSEVFEGMEIINDLVVSPWPWKQSISVSTLTTQSWCCPMGGCVTGRVRAFWLLAQHTVMCSVLKAAWEHHFCE